MLYKVKSAFFISVLLIFTTLIFFACELPEEDSEYIPTYEAEIVQEVIDGKTIAFVHAWINENNFTEKESHRSAGEFEIEYQVWYTKEDGHWQAFKSPESIPSRVYGNPAIRVNVGSLSEFDVQFSYPKGAKELYIYIEMRWFSVDNPEHDVTLDSAYYDFVGFDSTNSVCLD